MAEKSKAGMPSNIENAKNLATNNITSTPEMTHKSGKIENKAWWNDPDVDKRIDEYVKKEGNNEPLSGSQGLVAKGNQGDNAIVNPDAPDTADVTKRHNEEQALLSNAINTSEPVTGNVINEVPKVTEKVTPETVTPEGTTETPQSDMPKAPASANVDFSDYLKNYYGPKNGADYLKALWSNGVGGKAAAIGNVLGNLLGATGKGLAGQDYKTDWQTYKDNYIKEMADRNQKAFDQNMDISRQLRTNDVARGEMLKALEQYEKIGKGMTPEKFENIRKALTATGNSSQMEYYLSSVLGDLTSDPDFMKSVKDAGSNAAELLGNITKFGANTLRPLNYVFGGLNNGIIK